MPYIVFQSQCHCTDFTTLASFQSMLWWLFATWTAMPLVWRACLAKVDDCRPEVCRIFLTVLQVVRRLLLCRCAKLLGLEYTKGLQQHLHDLPQSGREQLVDDGGATRSWGQEGRRSQLGRTPDTQARQGGRLVSKLCRRQLSWCLQSPLGEIKAGHQNAEVGVTWRRVRFSKCKVVGECGVPQVAVSIMCPKVAQPIAHDLQSLDLLTNCRYRKNWDWQREPEVCINYVPP